MLIDGFSNQSDVLSPDPWSYLWENPQDYNLSQKNRDNYDLLLKTYNKTDFVSFTGSGVSQPLGIFDWNKLIEELHRIAKEENGFTGNKPNKKEQYPEFAEQICKYLEDKKKETDYYELIRRGMSPTINTTSLTLIYLILSIDTHLTTNFDRSIENAYNFLLYFADLFAVKNSYEKPTLNYLYNLDANSKRPAIYYLHGSINENIYILKKSDYEKFYPSDDKNQIPYITVIEDCLKYFYKNKNILFIGFSFQDPYIKKLFFYIAKENEREQREMGDFYYVQSGQRFKAKEIKHFVLIEKDNQIDGTIFEHLENYNFYPIIYETGKHIFLEFLLKKFIEKNRGKI